MKILIACEESQIVCKAFRAAGFEAYSCDLDDCSGGHPEWHIKGDAIIEAYSGKYGMMIAHPPCTFMSKAGARWMYPTAGNLDNTRYMKGMIGKAFFNMLKDAPIEHIVMENPLPLKVINLPPPTQIIQPYQHGHPYSKKTLLWLKNLPPLVPTKMIEEYGPFMPSNTGGKKRGQSTNRGIARNAKDASKTFTGIAAAMVQQWGDYLNTLKQ